jgi:hypothetical protein
MCRVGRLLRAARTCPAQEQRLSSGVTSVIMAVRHLAGETIRLDPASFQGEFLDVGWPHEQAGRSGGVAPSGSTRDHSTALSSARYPTKPFGKKAAAIAEKKDYFAGEDAAGKSAGSGSCVAPAGRWWRPEVTGGCRSRRSSRRGAAGFSCWMTADWR